jgi:hypothetical protein
MLAGNGAAIVRARRAGERWSFDAYATGFVEPSDFDLEAHSELAYLGNRSGLHVMAFDRSGTRHAGKLYVFRAGGPVVESPIAVPTQLDAGERPSRCSSAQRAGTPRVVVPFQPGTRHPVLVTDPIEPVRVLLTENAVMHGTPREACVAGYDAEAIPLEGSLSHDRERALIALDDLEHAWLFRTASDARSESNGIEYRVMSCRFDATAEIPPEVYRASGTQVPPAR